MVQALLSNYNPGLALSPAAKQIELDLLRTLPNNIYYENNHSKGVPKLRRVLLAYSLHNPELEYCQVTVKMVVNRAVTEPSRSFTMSYWGSFLLVLSSCFHNEETFKTKTLC